VPEAARPRSVTDPLVLVPLPLDESDRRLVLDTTLPGGRLLDRALALAGLLADGDATRVRVLEPGAPVPEHVLDHPTVVVVHPLCAFADAGDAAAVVRAASTGGAPAGAAAAVLPVTDTVKAVREDAAGTVVQRTLDRDAMVAAATPLVLPGGALRGLPVDDPATALRSLWAAFGDRLVRVPVGPGARRLHSADDVAVLAATLATAP
jgi:hypothetical protein